METAVNTMSRTPAMQPITIPAIAPDDNSGPPLFDDDGGMEGTVSFVFATFLWFWTDAATSCWIWLTPEAVEDCVARAT
jgi:hypothetical protein